MEWMMGLGFGFIVAGIWRARRPRFNKIEGYDLVSVLKVSR